MVIHNYMLPIATIYISPSKEYSIQLCVGLETSLYKRTDKPANTTDSR
jgi:hypothetical protein